MNFGMLILKMADPGKLSASKIEIYNSCPLSYYFTYIIKPKLPEIPAIVFGREIHVMLAEFYRKPSNKKFKKSPFTFSSIEAFINRWQYRWWRGVVNNEFGNYEQIAWKNNEQKKYYFALGVRILKAFYQHNIKLPYPKAIEKRFSVNIDNTKVVGIFDRLEIWKNKHYIIDYKTDRKSPEQNPFLLDKHPQFTLYSLAYEKLYAEELNGNKPIVVYLHLRTGKAFKTTRSEKDYNYLKQLIHSTKKGIENDEFVPFYGFHCNFCKYLPLCKKIYFDVSGKLKVSKTINNKKIEEIAMFSYSDKIEKSGKSLEIILMNIPSKQYNFIVEQFEYFCSLLERFYDGDKKVKKFFNERKNAIKWKSF